MTIKERVKGFCDIKEISIREFERLCDLTYTTINNAKTSLQPDNLKKIYHQFPELNLVWLLIEEGDMLNSGNTINPDNNETVFKMNNRIAALEKILQKRNEEIEDLTTKIEELEGLLGLGKQDEGINPGESDGRRETG